MVIKFRYEGTLQKITHRYTTSRKRNPNLVRPRKLYTTRVKIVPMDAENEKRGWYVKIRCSVPDDLVGKHVKFTESMKKTWTYKWTKRRKLIQCLESPALPEPIRTKTVYRDYIETLRSTFI